MDKNHYEEKLIHGRLMYRVGPGFLWAAVSVKTLSTRVLDLKSQVIDLEVRLRICGEEKE